MNFAEVVAEVVRITKRSDKTLDIQRQVNAAINLCCIDTDFARDRQEQTVPLDSTLYAQSIAISDLTRFRKVDAMRPSGRKAMLTLTEPNHIFGNCVEQTNCFYIAGDSIVLKLTALDSNMLVAYFAYPPVLTGTDTFWLLEAAPYMIIDKAAAKVFSNIGDDASARYHDASFKEHYTAARRDFRYGANP